MLIIRLLTKKFVWECSICVFIRWIASLMTKQRPIGGEDSCALIDDTSIAIAIFKYAAVRQAISENIQNAKNFLVRVS